MPVRTLLVVIYNYILPATLLHLLMLQSKDDTPTDDINFYRMLKMYGLSHRGEKLENV